MKTKILHKLTTMDSEETVNSGFNILVAGSDSDSYDKLDRRTAFEACLRYGLLTQPRRSGITW